MALSLGRLFVTLALKRRHLCHNVSVTRHGMSCCPRAIGLRAAARLMTTQVAWFCRSMQTFGDAMMLMKRWSEVDVGKMKTRRSLLKCPISLNLLYHAKTVRHGGAKHDCQIISRRLSSGCYSGHHKRDHFARLIDAWA